MAKESVKVKACMKCRGLFQTTTDLEVCPRCYEALERKFKVVRRFIREHELAGVEAVAEECDVPIKQILEWVREEKLSFSKESKVGIPCLSCGVSISIGKYCPSCQAKLSKNLSSVYNEKEETKSDESLVVKSARMHFLKHSR